MDSPHQFGSATAIMLFTRDLRVNDNPALAAASKSSRVVPLFVFDDRILRSDFTRPNRMQFLLDSLEDLRETLRQRGGDLIVRKGDTVTEVLRLAGETGAGSVHLSDDVSAFAALRAEGLQRAAAKERVDVHRHPGVTVVPPGDVAPTGGTHFKVFTPYLRAWEKRRWRDIAPTPRRITIPGDIDPGAMPALSSLVAGSPSVDVARGGESRARKQYQSWRHRSLDAYADDHDDLAGDATSRLSPYLHFGCLSPLEVAVDASERQGGAAFVRQLCWRDFHHQVTAAFPRIGTDDYRSRGDHWRADDDELEAWQQGLTGYPIVDAGMRQLAQEGWMHNRARLITASFLVKDLYLDWRVGARHFFDLLVDGDIANNNGNWQWVAGTGNDTRPNRVFNPLRQAERFDPDGDYVRRYVPELAGVRGKEIHHPWTLPEHERRGLGYPSPLVDHAEATARFRLHRA